MNIGIVTRRDGYNIGTSLQAYAIQQVISSLKCQCLVVNYCEYSWKARIRYFTLNVLGVITSFFPKSNFRIGYKQRMRFVAFDNRLKKNKKEISLYN